MNIYTSHRYAETFMGSIFLFLLSGRHFALCLVRFRHKNTWLGLEKDHVFNATWYNHHSNKLHLYILSSNQVQSQALYK